MRVDFVVIGAQKCGTSGLAKRLAAHPQVCFCERKEPAYFNRVQDWAEGLEEYHSLYSPEEGQICGEASTMYTFLPEWQGTHERLFAYNPEIKLIYVMRQPVERIISNYTHRLVRNYAEGPPEDAVFKCPTYLNRTRYGVQIRPYLELFQRDNVLLLVFEEYAADLVGALKEISQFLGISPEAFPPESSSVGEHKSVGEWYLRPSVEKMAASSRFRTVLRRVPPSVRRVLRRQVSSRLDDRPEFSPALKRSLWRFLEDDVQTIEALLGRRLDLWREGYTD